MEMEEGREEIDTLDVWMNMSLIFAKNYETRTAK